MANALSYTGNAGLGLGSNPDINVGAIDTKQLNETQRNLMLLDNERNMKMFQQKVKDRDQLTQLILDNQVATGDIDPKDQKYFDSDKQLVEKAYDAWGGNPNDTKGFRKYQAAVENLRDTAAHAQTRWAGLKKQEQELSQETLPNKIKARQSWLKNQRDQPFGSQIVPYQQLHDFSMADILSGVNPVKTSIIDPNNPISYDVATVDYNDILKNKRNDYINDQDKADSMDKFTDKLLKYNQPELQKTVATMDAKIAQYNAQRGFQKGDEGYVDPVKVQKNDNGAILITEPKTDLAAKWALANQEGYVTRTPKVNKDLARVQYDKARLGLEEERNQIQARKVGIEAAKANAYIKKLNAETKKIVDTANQEGTDIYKEYNAFIDNIKPGGITVSTGGKKTGELNAIYTNELPSGFQYINGPVVDSKGGVSAGRLVPFTSKDNNPYYIPQYVNPSTGEKLDINNLPSDVETGWQSAKSSGISKSDYIKILLKKGILELQLQGKNGTANYTSLAQSAKLINNKTTKKGQENVMNTEDQNPNAEPDLTPEPNQSDANPDSN